MYIKAVAPTLKMWLFPTALFAPIKHSATIPAAQSQAGRKLLPAIAA